jgi:hypothetical protein
LLRDSCLARRIQSTSRENFVARPNIYISDRRLPVFLSLFFFIFLEFSSFSQLAKLWRELSRAFSFLVGFEDVRRLDSNSMHHHRHRRVDFQTGEKKRRCS